MKDQHLLAFTDNDSAKFALIRGDSPSPASRELLSAAAALDAKAPVPVWYARCPSASSVADAPSRLDFPGLPAILPDAVERTCPVLKNANVDASQWR